MFQFLELEYQNLTVPANWNWTQTQKNQNPKTSQYEKKNLALLTKTINNFVKYISFTYTYYIDKEKSNVWNLNTKI